MIQQFMAHLKSGTFLLVSLLILTAACSLTSSTGSANAPTNAPSAMTSTEQLPLVYYYFAPIPGNTFPAGSVAILPDSLILSPTVSTLTRSDDVAANLESALQAMIDDPRNVWTSNDLVVSGVTFADGHAEAVLDVEIFGVGDIVLVAARMQFLMTVFAEPSVESATIILNGENIGNLGISHESEAKAADYAYTRTEIEQYMADNAYNG